MTAPISNGPTTTRLHHYAGHYFIASFDSAFDIEHNGESAQKFLTWWGDKQMTFYGTESFKKSRFV